MGEVNDGMLSPFQSLPEGCKSHIIFYTSIQDACSASLISKEFNSASKSDTVWGKFLPPDLKEIISNLVPWLSSKTKKELYRLLCHFSNPIDKGILINKGNRRFWLTKCSKKCYMLSAWELSIHKKEDPECWKWYELSGSRFSEVAELQRVDILDIRVKMPARSLSLKTNYGAYLVFKTNEYSYGLKTVAKASVSFAATAGTSGLSEPMEGDSVYLKIPTDVHYLTPTDEDDPGYRRREPDLQRRFVLVPRPEHEIDGRVPRERNDGWQEIMLGEFFNDEGVGDVEIKISEILDWKKGLILEGIELRPKEEA
nr:F-box protein PP2-B10-like [Coffea arabica]